MAWIADCDADGIADIAIGSPGAKSSDGRRMGSISIHTGKTGAGIAQAFGERHTTSFGRSLAVTGAGRTLVVGSPTWRRIEGPAPGVGRVDAYATPELVPRWHMHAPEGVLEFAKSITVVGDLNADGHADVVVCGGRINRGKPDESIKLFPGDIVALDGITGRVLWRSPDPRDLDWMHVHEVAMADAGDLDGDRVADVLRCQEVYPPERGGKAMGTLGAWSGADGRYLGQIRMPSGEEWLPGRVLHVEPPTPGGQSRIVMAVHARKSGRARVAVGRIRRASGEAGDGVMAWSEEWTVEVPPDAQVETASFGRGVGGSEFLVLGAPAAAPGRAWLAHREDPSRRQDLVDPAGSVGFGWKVLSGRDLDGDGVDDVVVSSSGTAGELESPAGPPDPPVVAFSGRDLRPLWLARRVRPAPAVVEPRDGIRAPADGDRR